MLTPTMNEHYYATLLERLSRDMLFILSMKGKASMVEGDDRRAMMTGVDICKKALIKDLEKVIGFLS